MGTVDSILQEQARFWEIENQWQALNAERKQLDASYGGGHERRLARLAEIKSRLAERLKIQDSDHGEFDARHELARSDQKGTFKPVADCPACNRIMAQSGRTALREEHAEIVRQCKEINSRITRLNELAELEEPIITGINQLGQSLGLPGFATDTSGNGFISGTGDIANFTIRGRPILDSGIYVEYKVGDATYYVALDASEQVVAYYDGDQGWRLSGLGKHMVQYVDEQVKTKVRGGFDYRHQVPTSDIVIMPRDGSGRHHHLVVDDDGTVITDEWRDK